MSSAAVITQFLRDAPGPVHVLVDDLDSSADHQAALALIQAEAPEPPSVARLSEVSEVTKGLTEGLTKSSTRGDARGPRPAQSAARAIVLVTADRASLRRLSLLLPRVGRRRTIAVWLTASASALVVRPRPEWPALRRLTASVGEGGALTVIELGEPIRGHHVLTECARQAVPGDPIVHGPVVPAFASRLPAPGLNLHGMVVASPTAVADDEVRVPPDVVLTPTSAPTSTPDAATPDAATPDAAAAETSLAHHALARPIVVRSSPPDPFDEFVFNPGGFVRDFTRGIVDFTNDRHPGSVTEADIAHLRSAQAVRLDTSELSAQTLLRLAGAGVPVLLTGPPAEQQAQLRSQLAPEFLAALSQPAALDDRLGREQHSLSVRRAAFDHHSTLAWRAALAAQAGIAWSAHPSLSVLLVTRRPEMLPSALRQLGAQTIFAGAAQSSPLVTQGEIVILTHGFEADPALVREHAGGAPTVLLSRDRDTVYGDALQAAAEAASGQLLLKVDDDDWYAPTAIADLLMAHHFAGADIVGMPSEFVYLGEFDQTVRRNHPSEVFNRFIAGGTIMLPAALLAEVGGFRPVRRWVDAQLLGAAQAAGAAIYRTHGLGYVLRRNPSGHTWQMEADNFKRPEIVDTVWPGFRPPFAVAAGLEPA